MGGGAAAGGGAVGSGSSAGEVSERSGGAGGGGTESVALGCRSSGGVPNDLPRSGGGPDGGVSAWFGSSNIDKSDGPPRDSALAVTTDDGAGAVSLLPQFGQRTV
jgi:hypothetical protein